MVFFYFSSITNKISYFDVKFKINTVFFSLDFYIATQCFFTACVLLAVSGLFYSALYLYLNRAYECYVQILSAGILNIAAGKTLCYVVL